MARIRLNQEYRNKCANRIKAHLFSEDTQEKQKYLELKEKQIKMFLNSFIFHDRIVIIISTLNLTHVMKMKTTVFGNRTYILKFIL